MRRFIPVILAVIVVVGAVFAAVTIRSPEKYFETQPTVSDSVVYIEINCKNVVGKSESAPEDGVILERSPVAYVDGDTVYDALVRAAKTYGIALDVGGSASHGAKYIRAIAEVREYDGGDLSGWEYCVNGVFPMTGCSAVDIAPGDEIRWLYTNDLGADVGNSFNADG
ncbi:MAG: DUF4430 domain-containing protein [Clostridia bacterium]|nr:DUF4430 domain-containing protein [Clostridia bacterium]